MRIALLAPMPPEQTGIADYAANFQAALQTHGAEVITPLAGVGNDPAQAVQRLEQVDWSRVDVVHAELGGGRLAEFEALKALSQRYRHLALSATVHDPERLVWRRARLPWPLSWAERLPSPAPQAATVLADPICLREERVLAARMDALVTLTTTGAAALRKRMKLPADKVQVIAHGNLLIEPAALPAMTPIRLLYFGFIYRGKGIEDLLEAIALVLRNKPSLAGNVRLTLAGGSAPEMAFAPGTRYLDELQQRIVALGLSEIIDWSLDVPIEQIARLIQAHHVMVLPYRESKKLALLGAMRGTSGALSWAAACGRGVITSDARAFAEEVAQGNGVIFAQGDVRALSEQLQALCEAPERAQVWATNAERVGRERQWPATAGRFLSLFHELSRGRRDVA